MECGIGGWRGVWGAEEPWPTKVRIALQLNGLPSHLRKGRLQFRMTNRSLIDNKRDTKTAMLPYWPNRPADAENIRAFYPGTGWKKYRNNSDAEGRVVFVGCGPDVQNTLNTAVAATNLLLLVDRV